MAGNVIVTSQRKMVFLTAVGFDAGTSAIAITAASIPVGASGAVIGNSAFGGNANWLAGTDPTTTLGIPLTSGDSFTVSGNPDTLGNLRFFQVAATVGKITFQFFMEQQG